MQCSSCRAVYSNGLDVCPRCKTAAPATTHLNETNTIPAPPQETLNAGSVEVTDKPCATDEAVAVEPKEDAAAATPVKSSTLIEFPGARAALPQWRKDLSERVREIQERRAREAALEAEEAKRRRVEQPAAAAAPVAAQLGLVPQPETPAVNPLVAKALRRIERARQPSQPMARSRGGAAAAATARVAEEQLQEEAGFEPALASRPVTAPIPLTETTPLERPIEVAREHNLVVVPPVVQKEEKKPEPRRVYEGVVDDSVASRLETEILPSTAELLYDDRASVLRRFTAGLIDLLVVAFASSPFAAIIELTNGNWIDPRVSASMGGIVLVVMFLYFAASTALTGRTWGMSLFSLRAVDVNTGLHPTTKQSIGRAMLYMLSLATACLGIIYALFDAEGRTAHDILTGTTVVKE